MVSRRRFLGWPPPRRWPASGATARRRPHPAPPHRPGRDRVQVARAAAQRPAGHARRPVDHRSERRQPGLLWCATPMARCCDRSRPTRRARAASPSTARRCGSDRPSATRTSAATPRPARCWSAGRRPAARPTRWPTTRRHGAARSPRRRPRRRRPHRPHRSPARLTQAPHLRFQGAHGQEWRDGKLWTTSTSSRSIYRIDPQRWVVERVLSTPGPRPHGLAWEGRYLWHNDGDLNAFFKFDVDSGQIVETIQLADSDPLSHGLTIWDGTLWYCDDVGVVCRMRL